MKQLSLFQEPEPEKETPEACPEGRGDKACAEARGIARLQRLADYYGNELYKLNRQFSELTLFYGQLFYAAKVSRGYLPKPIYDPAPSPCSGQALEKSVTRNSGLDAFLEYHATEEERENRKRYEEQK